MSHPVMKATTIFSRRLQQERISTRGLFSLMTVQASSSLSALDEQLVCRQGEMHFRAILAQEVVVSKEVSAQKLEGS